MWAREPSKANAAILHTGFDAKPGTLEAALVARGHALLGAYAAETGIAVEPTGALLVAWTDEQYASLPALAERAPQPTATTTATSSTALRSLSASHTSARARSARSRSPTRASSTRGRP